MHLHCGFSVARLLKGLSNTLCSIHMEGRQDLSFWETIRLKSLPTFECSALHKQVNMITAVWVGFFFEGAKNTPQKLTCALKKGSIQKKRLVVSNCYFVRGRALVFWGVIPTLSSIRDSSKSPCAFLSSVLVASNRWMRAENPCRGSWESGSSDSWEIGEVIQFFS